jgi:heat shock protein HslJ
VWFSGHCRNGAPLAKIKRRAISKPLPTDNRVEFSMLRSLAILAAIISSASTTFAAERTFPFDSELMLDAKPMKGSKRIPVMTVGPSGKAEIDMWCNSIEGKVVVVDSTITVMTGTKTARQCDAARTRLDDELLEALSQATTWSREGDVLTLRGAKTLRFRQATN